MAKRYRSRPVGAEGRLSATEYLANGSSGRILLKNSFDGRFSSFLGVLKPFPKQRSPILERM